MTGLKAHLVTAHSGSLACESCLFLLFYPDQHQAGSEKRVRRGLLQVSQGKRDNRYFDGKRDRHYGGVGPSSV